MPLPNLNDLPNNDIDLDAFNDEFEESEEDLEDITEDNLDYDEDLAIEDDEFNEDVSIDLEEDVPDINDDIVEKDESFQDPYAIPNTNTENSEEKSFPAISNKLKSKKDNSLKEKSKINIDIKKIGMIVLGVLAFLIITFIILNIFSGKSKNNSDNSTISKKESKTAKGLKIKDHYIENGEFYVSIDSDKDVNIEYIETAFMNDDRIIKCTSFNPYVDKGENEVLLEDCDDAILDEDVVQYIDNIKMEENNNE